MGKKFWLGPELKCAISFIHVMDIQKDAHIKLIPPQKFFVTNEHPDAVI